MLNSHLLESKPDMALQLSLGVFRPPLSPSWIWLQSRDVSRAASPPEGSELLLASGPLGAEPAWHREGPPRLCPCDCEAICARGWPRKRRTATGGPVSGCQTRAGGAPPVTPSLEAGGEAQRGSCANASQPLTVLAAHRLSALGVWTVDGGGEEDVYDESKHVLNALDFPLLAGTQSTRGPSSRPGRPEQLSPHCLAGT